MGSSLSSNPSRRARKPKDVARKNQQALVAIKEQKPNQFKLFDFKRIGSRKRKPKRMQNDEQINVQKKDEEDRRKLIDPRLQITHPVNGETMVQVHDNRKQKGTNNANSGHKNEEEKANLRTGLEADTHGPKNRHRKSEVMRSSGKENEKFDEVRDELNRKFGNRLEHQNKISDLPKNKKKSERNEREMEKGLVKKVSVKQSEPENLPHTSNQELSNSCNERNDSSRKGTRYSRSTSLAERKSQKENSEEEMNILIIGESGVGKSTWVNSIVNYLKYKNLDEAENEGVVCVIPTSFIVTYATDDDIVRQVVQVGNQDSNEILHSGKSATQDPQTYTFYLGKKLVRLIDTPGLGDTEGIERDNENLSKILNHISFLKEIHGICILLKSNETRLGVLFKFCISGLLSNLHKNAAKNVVFCFTNSRSSFYAPGDTTSILEDYLHELNLTDMITLSKETMFCLDNEAFRYLCTLKYKNIPKREHEKGEYAKSWMKSVSETRRLFDKIKTLKPHRVADTTHLCSVKSKIYNLMEPIAEISKTIQMNLVIKEEQEQNFNKAEPNIVGKLKKLNLKTIVQKIEPLDYPRMVCRNEKCIRESINDSNLTVPEYKICHEKCKLLNFIGEVGVDKRLKVCKRFNWQANCSKCGCSWKDHKHQKFSVVNQEVDVTYSVVEDENMEKTKKFEKMKKKVEKTIQAFREEQDFILETCLKFKIFLKENGLTKYNDHFKDYLKDLIREEKKKCNPTKNDEELLNNLNELLKRYEERDKKIVEDMEGKSKSITPDDVLDLIEKLYKLRLTGKQIETNAESAYISNQKNFKYAEKPLPIGSVSDF